MQADLEQETAPIKYICTNHVDTFGFSSWKSYLKHCLHHSEQPIIDLPEEVKEKAEDKVKSVKKRARTRLGRYIADDPTTPKNEAYEDNQDK